MSDAQDVEHCEPENDEFIDTSVKIKGFSAASHDWRCLTNWPNLTLYDYAEETLKDMNKQDAEMLSMFSKRTGIKFSFLNVSYLELEYVIYWNNVPRGGEHDVADGHCANMNQTVDKTTVLNCMQEALEYASVTMKDCATSRAWLSRDNDKHYVNSGILVKIFAADIPTWGNIFHEALMKRITQMYPTLDALKGALLLRRPPSHCSPVDYMRSTLSELLNAEHLEEVAICHMCNFSRPNHYLYWDRNKLSALYGTPFRQYYLGFANKCCGRFEWYWDNQNDNTPLGTTVIGSPQSRRLAAGTNYVRNVSFDFDFCSPCVGRLLAANSDTAELEAFLFKVKSFVRNMKNANDPKWETGKRIVANLQTVVVMRKPNADWMDVCMQYAAERYGPSQKHALLQMKFDRFWRNQEDTVQILLKTLIKIFETHVELRKRGDAGIGADSDVRILAMYCEALLCWALNGTMEPEIGKESYQQSIIDALHLHPATFGVSFFGGSDTAEDENEDFQGLAFCNDVVVIENGELVLVA